MREAGSYGGLGNRPDGLGNRSDTGCPSDGRSKLGLLLVCAAAVLDALQSHGRAGMNL